jgi:glycerol transport system ATP-binding protein
VLLGPTLAGKTSLMRLMAGLDKPTSGSSWSTARTSPACRCRSAVAMVYQQFINYPSLTVYENIASPLRVQGKPKGRDRSPVHEAAALLKLSPI